MAFNWSANHHARLGNLLKSGFESDLTLLVGPQQQEVKVHKIILSIGSRVFYAQIKSLEDGVDQLSFPNADVSVFVRLLQYLYTGEIAITNFQEALPVLHLASEFEMNELITQCAQLLKENFTVENVLMIFQQAMLSGHKELIKSSLVYICRNAQDVLGQETFANLPLDCLIEIVQQDNLEVIRELDIFQAACRWGTAECHRKGADPLDPPQMRAVMEKVLKWIRFPLMEQSEFAMYVSTRSLLQMEELVNLLVCFSVPVEQRAGLPEGRYSSVPRRFINPSELEQRRMSQSHQAPSSGGVGVGGGDEFEAQLFRPQPNLTPQQHQLFNKMFGNMGLANQKK